MAWAFRTCVIASAQSAAVSRSSPRRATGPSSPQRLRAATLQHHTLHESDAAASRPSSALISGCSWSRAETQRSHRHCRRQVCPSRRGFESIHFAPSLITDLGGVALGNGRRRQQPASAGRRHPPTIGVRLIGVSSRELELGTQPQRMCAPVDDCRLARRLADAGTRTTRATDDSRMRTRGKRRIASLARCQCEAVGARAFVEMACV